MVEKKRSNRGKTSGRKSPTKPTGDRPLLQSEPPMKFKFLIASLVLIAAICFLYPGHVFQDKIFFAGDNQAAASFAAALKHGLADEGAYPVWNPYLFAGMPSFGSLSHTPYVYPVGAVLGILSKYLFFPNYLWLLFHTFLTGLGTYLLLRDRQVWFIPAVTAGVLIMWMPNLVAVGANGHGSQACAVGYIPIALLFWDRLWRGKGLVLYGAALVAVLGLSMLRGHLQISYYTYMLIGLHLLVFGVMRLVDGSRGTIPKSTALPRKWFDKLTNRGEKYSTGSAAAEIVWAAAVLAVIVAASLMICAVLYLPVHDYAQYSTRGASEAGGLDYGYATSWSLHPSEALTFLFPFSFGFGKDLYFGHMPFTDYPNYVGLIILAFAGLALFRVRDRFTIFLTVVVIVTTFISFGKYLPILYDPLFKWLPYFDKFRVPVMILIVQQIAFLVLFGIGLNKILRSDPSAGQKFAVRGLAAALLIFVLVILTQSFWSGEFAGLISKNIRATRNPQEQVLVAKVVGGFLFRDLVRFAIVLSAMFALLFLYFNRKLSYAVFGLLLLVLAATDFYIIDRKILHPEKFRQHEQLRIIHDRSVQDKYKDPDDLIRFLKKDSRHFRIFPLDSPQRPFSQMFQSNRFMNFGISSIGGYHPAKLKVYEEFFGALTRSLSVGRFQLIDMLNVRYVVTGVELPGIPRLREVWRGVNYAGQQRFAYENLPAMPRVWQVGSYRVATAEQALDLLAEGKVDLASTVILEKNPVIEPVPGDTSAVEAVVESYGYNEIHVTAKSNTPSILVLSEIYYPDWQVEVDGEPAELLRANHIIRAVALPAGEHEVVFSYDTSLLKKGAVVSATVLGLVTLIIIVSLVLSMRGRKGGNASSRTDV